MEGLVIRTGRQEDLVEVLRLWQQAVEFHTACDPSLAMRCDAEAQESMRTYLQTNLDNPDGRLFVAEVAGVGGLVGYLLAQVRTISPLAIPPTCGVISDICVEEQWRRQGIGRELFYAARDWFRERGQTLIRLHVATANPISQAFWRAMGGVEQMVLMRITI